MNAFPRGYSVAFHCAGLKANQWRLLRNELFKVQAKVLFRAPDTRGPISLCYLNKPEKEVTHADWKNFLQRLTNLSSEYDLLLLAGKYQGSLLNHLDLQRMTTIEDSAQIQLVSYINSLKHQPNVALRGALEMSQQCMAMAKYAKEKEQGAEKSEQA
jgi:hypothetical protein